MSSALHQARVEGAAHGVGRAPAGALRQWEGPGLLRDPTGTRHGDPDDAPQVSSNSFRSVCLM